MPLFKLNLPSGQLPDAVLQPAAKTELDMEAHLEAWLENSPAALAEEPFLWIGRQASASVEEKTIFPDLLGLDATGEVVIVELKKGRPPREVVAQILEYAAWADDLTDAEIQRISALYFSKTSRYPENSLEDIFAETFETDFQSLNS